MQTMGSRALLLLKAPSSSLKCNQFLNNTISSSSSSSKSKLFIRNFSATNGSSHPPPDLPCLAETARISLTPQEVEEFAPKIRQVVDWFGQLQAVDLSGIEPAIRADTEGENLRDDISETFENREAMLSAVPCYEEPYIKVPKVLNKE